MKTKKYLTAGTYPKTNGKIVEMEKKNRYENQNYHCRNTCSSKIYSEKTETISISPAHIILLLSTPEGTVLL